MGRFSWPWWPRSKNKSRDDTVLASKRIEGGDRRQLLQALSAMATGGTLAAMSQAAEAKDSSDLPAPKRALTGRDESGKSVFKSFDVTPKVVEIDSNPGLTFYELYMTEGVPGLTGLEPDPMLKGTKAFPSPGGTMFRLISRNHWLRISAEMCRLLLVMCSTAPAKPMRSSFLRQPPHTRR